MKVLLALIIAFFAAALTHASSGIPETPAELRAYQERGMRIWLAAEPPPEAYVLPEDQKRALLFARPCRPVDVGHGCHPVYPGRPELANELQRDVPCEIPFAEAPSLMTFRDVSQCYRMTSSQRFRGVWIDAFEGSRFFPGAESPPAERRLNYKAQDVQVQIEKERKASIWLNVGHAGLKQGQKTDGVRRAYLIDFIGRQTLYPGHYGHLGMSAHEIEVDQIIYIKPLN